VKYLPWQTWITGLIIFTPWLIFSSAYFGSPIPQTIGSKAVTYSIDSTQALTLFLQHYATPFQGQLLLGSISIIVGIVLYPALAFIGLRATMAKSGRALPMLAYPWIYALVYCIANPLIFRWYLSPPLPAYFMAIVLGVAALVVLIPQHRAQQIIFAAVTVITLIFSLNAWALHPDHGPDRPAPRMAFHDLELNYQRMALTLRSEYGLTDDDVLAAGDIGALGFFSRAEIFDTIGLVTEGTTPYYADRDYIESIRVDGSNYAIPPDLVLDAQPDFIVVMEAFVREGLLKDDRFLEQYTLIEEIPTDYYGTGMLAFQRNDS
jgi:hypothetical protein